VTNNKYHTLYIDPPWQTKAGRPLNGYTLVDGKQVWTGASNQSRKLSYPTMSLEEIASLPVCDLAEPNAHLYLWAINQYLPDAFGILKAWGFKHSTVLIWNKKPMGGGLGGAYRITTEFLLYARRGKLSTKKNSYWYLFRSEERIR
jgi:N6-adenosine-specific RNA methylase IME4